MLLHHLAMFTQNSYWGNSLFSKPRFKLLKNGPIELKPCYPSTVCGGGGLVLWCPLNEKQGNEMMSKMVCALKKLSRLFFLILKYQWPLMFECYSITNKSWADHHLIKKMEFQTKSSEARKNYFREMGSLLSPYYMMGHSVAAASPLQAGWPD